MFLSLPFFDRVLFFLWLVGGGIKSKNFSINLKKNLMKSNTKIKKQLKFLHKTNFLKKSICSFSEGNLQIIVDTLIFH